MREERGGSRGETRAEGGMRGTYEGRRGGEEGTGVLRFPTKLAFIQHS